MGTPGPLLASLTSDTTLWEGSMLALPLPGCVTAGQLLGLSECQAHHGLEQHPTLQ